MVDQHLATHELAANVKTVQAFDEMLEELSRLGRTGPPEATAPRQAPAPDD